MVALPQVRHTFGLAQAQASDWLALLFLGALPALFVARQADRFGRRRLLLVSVAGYTVATAATAAAPTIISFGLCQLCAQAFLALEATLTWTVIAEELPARARGFGFGVLAVLGAGTGALAWGLLLSPHHLSWCSHARAVALLAAARLLPSSSWWSASPRQRAGNLSRPRGSPTAQRRQVSSFR